VPSCEPCQVGVPLVNTGRSRPDEPIGACKNCGSLACLNHGSRTTGPQFLCIECDVQLQARFAASYDPWYRRKIGLDPADDEDEKPPGGGGGLGEPLPAAVVRALGVAALAERARRLFLAAYSDELVELTWVPNHGTWAEQRPVYGALYQAALEVLPSVRDQIDEAMAPQAELFATALGGRGEPPLSPLQALWSELRGQARELMAMAVTLVSILRLPEQRLTEGLRAMVAAAGIEIPDRLELRTEPLWVPWPPMATGTVTA
jgi:hypothetical protein